MTTESKEETKELTEKELADKMNAIGQKKQQEFVDKFNKISEEYGITFAGQPTIDQEGRIKVNVVLAARQ